MQLTIEVLPAPLGPMSENSSPSFTPKLTSVSARTPPKRSDTPRTSKPYSTHSSVCGVSDALWFVLSTIRSVVRDRSNRPVRSRRQGLFQIPTSVVGSSRLDLGQSVTAVVAADLS